MCVATFTMTNEILTVNVDARLATVLDGQRRQSIDRHVLTSGALFGRCSLLIDNNIADGIRLVVCAHVHIDLMSKSAEWSLDLIDILQCRAGR
jgi:hypothetical protein